MGANKKQQNPAKILNASNPYFQRRAQVACKQGEGIIDTLGGSLVNKATDINLFQYDLSNQVVNVNAKLQ